MTDQTPATVLRAAATLLRELTDRAIHEDRTNWFPSNTLGSQSPVVVDDPKEPSVLIETYAARLEAVNRYIAAMDPGVGRAIAGWLEEEAHRYEAAVTAARRVFHDDPAECEAFLTTGPGTPSEHALSVARQILGTQET